MRVERMVRSSTSRGSRRAQGGSLGCGVASQPSPAATDLVVVVGRLLVGAGVLDKHMLVVEGGARAAHELPSHAGEARAAYKLRVLWDAATMAGTDELSSCTHRLSGRARRVRLGCRAPARPSSTAPPPAALTASSSGSRQNSSPCRWALAAPGGRGQRR